jgi:NADH dehydrogenase
LIPNRKKSRIVIIGSNFAGLSAASKLKKCHDVTVIDSKAHFQWTPNIHEILSDVKKENNLRVDLKTAISSLGHKFIQQDVSAIDAKAQTVILHNNETISYDALLIASGHTRANYGIKGANKYAIGFRHASEVVKISDGIEKLLTSSDKPLNINIVGGGFSGVEILGELLRKYAKNPRIHINLIDSASGLVQGLPEKLSLDIIDQCKSQQVTFHFNKTITEVKRASIHFSDQNCIPSDLSIWSAGTTLPEYLNSLNEHAISNGIAVNLSLQTKAFKNIFVAGDSASLPIAVPKQASIAIDMGMHVAANINRYCAKQTLQAFKIRTKPILLSLGDINTYFIQGRLVLASPMLATVKEAVYQLWMARLSALLPLDQSVLGIAGRLTLSTEKLLLAEVLKLRPRVLLSRSKIL